MVKIVLDGFGGDRSPSVNVEGAVGVVNENNEISVVITGDEKILAAELGKYTYDKSRISIVHAPEVISCEEKPTEAIKRKETSLVKAFELLKSDEETKALVTIGSTGAALCGAVLKIGRIHNVKRPAFCPILPTMNGGIVGVCDSGANVDCDSLNLIQFAEMGSLYMEKTYNIARPRVALLNVGTEEEKGDLLRKETFLALSENKKLNFVGNMESRDLLSGKYDLVVCDGFSGNVLIKSTEGACLEMLKLLKKAFTSSFKNKMGALLLKKSVYELKDFMDYNNYGGGVMLGARKLIIKGHGSSKAKSVKNCILQAYAMETGGLIASLNENFNQAE